MRRGRTVGTDLLAPLAAAMRVDVFGMRVSLLPAIAGLTAHEDPPQHAMHEALARRRVYVHTARWTSLGLALVEAMHLGLPVVALGTTEAPMAVPPDAGVVTTSASRLIDAARALAGDPSRAAEAGRAARRHALAHYGLARFLRDWEVLLAGVR